MNNINQLLQKIRALHTTTTTYTITYHYCIHFVFF